MKKRILLVLLVAVLLALAVLFGVRSLRGGKSAPSESQAAEESAAPTAIQSALMPTGETEEAGAAENVAVGDGAALD